jgi:hypothetical protein
MSLIIVLSAADIMECPVLEDTGFMFDEAAVLGELIQERLYIAVWLVEWLGHLPLFS